MAEAKKTAVAKSAAKAVAAKAADVEKNDAAAVVAEASKAETKKPAARKTTAKAAAKKTEAKKTTAKKTTTTRGRKAEVKEVVHVQFEGKSYTTEDLVKSAKDVWKYDLKQKVSDFKSVEIYVKPEESLAYYVINDDVTGSFLI